MGEIPHLDRAVGLPPSERNRQQEFEERLAELFTSDKDERIPGLEIDKSRHDREILHVAQGAVDRYLGLFGRLKRAIPLGNIHIVPVGGVERFTKGRHIGGAASFIRGSVVIDRTPSDTEFGTIAFHELFHLKSYSALQITRPTWGKDRCLAEYRHGFAVVKRNGTAEYFTDLEESIVTYFTHCFYRDYMKENTSVFYDASTTMPAISRSDELEMLNHLVDEIWDRNREVYLRRHQILEVFIRAQINGDLLPVARLVDRTYGKGAFKALGEKTGTRLT